MLFVFNRRPFSQAGRRGFDPRLPLFKINKLQSDGCCELSLEWAAPGQRGLGGRRCSWFSWCLVTCECQLDALAFGAVMARTKIKFEEGSGNIFADLGFPNADELYSQAKIGFQVFELLTKRSLSDREAATLLGIHKTRVLPPDERAFHSVS